MKNLLVNFWKDEDGATAIEYGLIAGLIAVAIIGALLLVSDELKLLFGKITTELKAVDAGKA